MNIIAYNQKLTTGNKKIFPNFLDLSILSSSNKMFIIFVIAMLAAVYASTDIAARVRYGAPDFKAKAVFSDSFIDITFSDYQARGEWTVLLFYPFDYTFVCPTELKSYSAAASKFDSLKAKVLAISTDSHHAHLAWTRAKGEDGGVGKLNIPLVADTAHEISRAYGVLVTDPEDDMYGAALRGLFIIDPKGKIRMMQINDDSVGRNVDETLRLLQGFQYADAHVGEACPASWTPGADAIEANPWGAKMYFEKHFK
jgi:alkyl hydroperoxide reductase subunit AhpC